MINPESFEDQVSKADLEETGSNANIENPVNDDANVFKGELDEEAANDIELAPEDREEEGYDPYNKAA